MYYISCFADEIAASLDEQLQIMGELSIRWLSLRNADGCAVLDFTDEQLKEMRRKLEAAGVGVSSIGSPIGKSPVVDTSGTWLEQTKRALAIADILHTDKIRIFSFYMKPEEKDLYRTEVLERLHKMTALAEEAHVTLLLENEAGIYGESSDRCKDLLESVNHSCFRACFDPSNYVAAGEHPFDQSFRQVRDYIAYFHIKDSRHQDGVIVPAGEGDAQIAQILRACAGRGFFLTLEPHLQHAFADRGFSGPERFRVAYKALTDILTNENIAYQ